MQIIKYLYIWFYSTTTRGPFCYWMPNAIEIAFEVFTIWIFNKCTNEEQKQPLTAINQHNFISRSNLFYFGKRELINKNQRQHTDPKPPTNHHIKEIAFPLEKFW